MEYGNIRRGIFLTRPNRFIAHVLLQGEETVCHVKNTGRCRELLIPGAVVFLEKSDNPSRKTRYDLVAVEKGSRLINMDAQAPNRAFGEWVTQFEPTVTAVHPEYVFGQSRLDFCIETPRGLHLVEVKGVTLEENGHARFPDAPTERGVRHLHELMRAVDLGYRATAFFVIQMADVTDFAPNDDTHPAFGTALRLAVSSGVAARAFTCDVTPRSMRVCREVPVVL